MYRICRTEVTLKIALYIKMTKDGPLDLNNMQNCLFPPSDNKDSMKMCSCLKNIIQLFYAKDSFLEVDVFCQMLLPLTSLVYFLIVPW